MSIEDRKPIIIETKTVTLQKIYDMLMSQRFTEWYLTRFEDHVGGCPDTPTKNEIVLDLQRLLK